ncbi:GNAT family N-acetyltransferase [Streptomyces syringium]|uniref:GNAT family N-acetyltransferase n=1 Tax=Streptomyces syringium TaxID=76729 RepID=UPI0036A35C34
MTTSPARTAVVPVAEIFELRRSVLRPGLPAEAAVFAEDAAPGTFHIAAYDERGSVRACVSFFPEALPGEAGFFPEALPGEDGDAAYRFRGMASDPAVRGLGYGVAVLRAGLDQAAARGAGLAWCNGRTSARGFYEHQGFTVTGEEFVVESVGPHYLFTIKLPG